MRMQWLGMGVGLAVLGAASIGLAMKAEKFEGKPTFDAGSVNGAFVWHQPDGYLVRFTTKTGDPPRHLYGQVCAGAEKIDSVTPVLLEAGEYARLGPHEHCVWFEFNTFGHIDGFDFKTSAKNLTFDFKHGKREENKNVPAANIYVGQAKEHPQASPFVRTP